MKILVIDDSEFFRKMISMYLSSELTGSSIDVYDFDRLGKPVDDFDWEKYDIVLMDYDLGGHGTGLDWLREYRGRPGFPPVIMLTGEGNEYVAVNAIKLGAADYLNKKDLEKHSICELVRKNARQAIPADEDKNKFSDEATLIFDKPQKDDDLAGRQLSIGYKLYSKIGETPTSRVYLAEKTPGTVTLVMKILDLRKIRNRKFIERFRRESEFILQIKNPCVVEVYESGMTDEFGYIVMEFFPRGDLKDRIMTRPTPDLALIYMQHIMHGLAAIHARGIVHRDLKPANIMFRSDDSLALADFGISKQMNNELSDTTQGRIIGTPYYMSPEQGNGFDVDERSDIYSAGVLFFEILSGAKPYIGKTMVDVVYRHMTDPVPQLDTELSHFQPVMEKLLAKKPEDRYQSAEQVIDVLDELERKYYPA